MKSTFIFIGLGVLFRIQPCLAQNQRIIEPSMTIPDSLIGDYVGGIHFGAHISKDGKLVAWELTSIEIWNWKQHTYIVQYQTDPKRYVWLKDKGIYEMQIIAHLRNINTPSGYELAKNIIPWCEQYARKLKIIPAAGPKGRNIVLEGEEARYYTFVASFGAKKQIDKIEAYMKKRRSKQIVPKN